MPVKDETCQRCNSKSSQPLTYGIELQYVTIVLDKLASDKAYRDNFMPNLRSQICCSGVQIPYMIIHCSDGERVRITKKGGLPMTIADIEEQLEFCKDLTGTSDSKKVTAPSRKIKVKVQKKK